MPRFVALLRGVTPTNAKMPELKTCFEQAGFANVKTLLATGNVAFDARARSEAVLLREIEAAMEEHIGRVFSTLVRPSTHLRALIGTDPYAGFRVPAAAKRVVTFLPEAPKATIVLPIEADGVQILRVDGREAFTAYVPHPKGPVFMTMIAKCFGTNVTTRTWDTVKKCALA